MAFSSMYTAYALLRVPVSTLVAATAFLSEFPQTFSGRRLYKQGRARRVPQIRPVELPVSRSTLFGLPGRLSFVSRANFVRRLGSFALFVCTGGLIANAAAREKHLRQECAERPDGE